MKQPQIDWSTDVNTVTVAPSPFAEARETSALAGVAAGKKAGATCALMLQLITEAGEAGISDPELADILKLPRASVCARRNEIRLWLWPSARRVPSPYGRLCVAWRRATEAEVAINRQRAAAMQAMA